MIFRLLTSIAHLSCTECLWVKTFVCMYCLSITRSWSSVLVIRYCTSLILGYACNSRSTLEYFVKERYHNFFFLNHLDSLWERNCYLLVRGKSFSCLGNLKCEENNMFHSSLIDSSSKEILTVKLFSIYWKLFNLPKCISVGRMNFYTKSCSWARLYYIWTNISGILGTSPMFICFRS